jgi:hypothetical protein
MTNLVLPAADFAAQRRFTVFARRLVRLPEAGEGALDYLVPEARWQELLAQAPDEELWLMALSQATGVYFFPSREWPERLLRFLKLLKVRRLLEAGAGRGYLSAALAPLCAAAGMEFAALDCQAGEFQSPLPVSPQVAAGDVFVVGEEFQPEAIFYGWPPPHQSLAPLFRIAGLRCLLMAGEPGGGVTGAREDWQRLPHRQSAALSRYCRGRTGSSRHRVTVFYRDGG